jgi:putative oxidoreductase
MPSQLFFDTWAPRAVALLRIVTAYLFLQHATAKLFHVPHVASFDGVQPMTFIWYVGIFELVFGALLLIGLFSRLAAFLLSGQMAVAYFMAHAPRGNPLSPMLNQGEQAVMFCFIFLALAALGPGAWSVDGARTAGDRVPVSS